MSDKVVVVAGAATGIGRASALRLALEGAAIIAASPAGESAHIDSLVEDVKAAGGKAIGMAFDATDEASVKALVDAAVDKFGGLDAVHANFADLRVIFDDSDILSVSDDVLERTLNVNLKGMVRITRHALPHMIARGGGAMVYTSSTASKIGEPVRPCYAMAKAGINALVRHVASAWGQKGVRANAILPGLVITPEKRSTMPSDLQEQVLAAGRSTRLGEVEDIAAMVALLVSKDGEWVNGQCIAVDGGSTLN
ncbi:NAD(P)-dependent dehydrogenase (short-subunit alcohol dehydrogenase family) [Sphingobium sp. OAS761]|uniref:SDR family NAD(P)-dependent oxidoreductase n=1 Tax=Sphingobium sp. OAS761 TaxID=2817901 RepID=UPI0020A14842|nr:SDR family oxidoreductase [Sphingobium sp. OAS761]MCP1471693.1 NAD(P)-dependent dehydrogenase (short-subunit alcohol dehydrogenase family) [Sphingobium sp. OAS761]